MRLSLKSQSWGHRPRKTALAFACALASSGAAQALEIDTGNPDVKVRFDTTVRYNLGLRAKDCDVNICGNGTGAGDVTGYQSDAKFRKAGDIVTNRIDLLPEFDAVYQNKFGVRLSGAAWYDHAYDNRIEGDAALDASGFGQGAGTSGGPYISSTKRFVRGPSGELLDAFVFGRAEIGGVPVSVKLGKHNLYWGESLFSFVNGVSYGQGPVDFRKAIATPGIEAKEAFRPLNQISASAELTDTISLSAQYLLDWKPTILPDGGTYFGAADGLNMVGGNTTIFGTPYNGITGRPKHKHGDFGVALKLRPEWFDGTIGLYYRQYTDKSPQLVANGLVLTGLPAPFPAVAATGFGLDYTSPRAKMFALSLSKQVYDLSIGADLTYRKDSQLAAVPFATPSGAADLSAVGGPAGALGNSTLPTGDVFSGVINTIAYFGKTALFGSAVMQAEINFSHRVKVNKSPATYFAQGYSCAAEVATGFPYACATRNAVGVAVNFEPKWFQVLNGVDLSMPLFVSLGIKGNSPVMFGDNEGQGSYAIGASADIQSRYTVSLKYNGFLAKHEQDGLGASSYSNAALGKTWDRDWVSLTLKTTF